MHKDATLEFILKSAIFKVMARLKDIFDVKLAEF
jgi:hypothetical protein